MNFRHFRAQMGCQNGKVILARVLMLFLIGTFALCASFAYAGQFDFIALADIHFDPFTSCSGNKPCVLIEKLRRNPVEKWPDLFAHYSAPAKRFQDSNYQLLVSALSASSQIADKSHAQFVLVLGDFLGHEFRSRYKRYSSDKTASQYQLFTEKTLAFLTRELASAFPSLDIYTVVGNNDSYQGDYIIKPDGRFFSDAGRMWSGLIKNQHNKLVMQEQFSHAGYYSVVLPSPANSILIVMNTVLFSTKAKGRNLDKIASQELNWLHAQLQKAKEFHQGVFLAMHIPEGIDFYATKRTRLFRLITLWKPQYATRFQSELNQYSAQIAGIFAGHLHRNWFQMAKLDHAEIPVIGIISISPIFGNNPGFGRISYFTDPIRLDNVSTWSFPLYGTVWMQQTWRKDFFVI